MPLGQRQVVDLMVELSAHLLEPWFLQTLALDVGPGSPSTIVLNSSSPLPATEYLYPGALVVVGWHADDAEVVEIIDVVDDNTFSGNLVNAHVSGESVFSATFPTQQPTDPVFTQAEIQGYIAQAQNEFLTKVPLIFEFFDQQTILGQSHQTVPDTAIELERVAVQTALTFNLVSIYRQYDTVWATVVPDVTQPPYNFLPGLGILIDEVSDPSFNSASNQPYVLTGAASWLPGGGGYGAGGYGQGGYGGGYGALLSWSQTDPNTIPLEGTGILSLPLWTRLYESSQNQIAMQNPNWAVDQSPSYPTNWFEDREGIYGWGLAPIPQAGFYLELLCSVRGPTFLNLLDSLEVPDVFAYPILYKSLEYCWNKNGIQRSPTLARWASAKFDYWVMLADRFLRNVVEKIGGR